MYPATAWSDDDDFSHHHHKITTTSTRWQHHGRWTRRRGPVTTPRICSESATDSMSRIQEFQAHHSNSCWNGDHSGWQRGCITSRFHHFFGYVFFFLTLLMIICESINIYRTGPSHHQGFATWIMEGGSKILVTTALYVILALVLVLKKLWYIEGFCEHFYFQVLCFIRTVYRNTAVKVAVPYRPSIPKKLYGTVMPKTHPFWPVILTAVTVIRYGAQP